MLTVAAYRFETPTLHEEDINTAWDEALHAVDSWLSRKGALDVNSKSGEFASKTKGATGTFTRTVISSTLGLLDEVALRESTEQGHEFTTTVSLIKSASQLYFYLTLAAEHTGTSLAPIIIYPRCPELVRNILGLREDWAFGGSEVPPSKPIVLSGKESAQSLAGYLMNPERTLPVTVVSELEGQAVWPDLSEKLAIDLAGLSAVVTIDGAASWELNNALGKRRSCYLGAVRVYWPLSHPSGNPDDLVSNLWTAERLLSDDSDAKGLSRFTTTLRRRVMNTAALAVSAPAIIRQIKSEDSRQQLAKLQEKADANSEELELARLFIEENERLKDELDKAKDEAARQAARAETAEYALEQVKSGQSLNDGTDEDELPASPSDGEVRYYKKIHSTPSYDVLVRISDCGHNKWQPSNKADKAKKGIAKLENRDDWKSLYHCASCHGGGVWKVTW